MYTLSENSVSCADTKIITAGVSARLMQNLSMRTTQPYLEVPALSAARIRTRKRHDGDTLAGGEGDGKGGLFDKNRKDRNYYVISEEFETRQRAEYNKSPSSSNRLAFEDEGILPSENCPFRSTRSFRISFFHRSLCGKTSPHAEGASTCRLRNIREISQPDIVSR